MNSIVIGSGFGGIAAALRLRAKGHNVTLIEKHPDLGGRARVFKRNGFTYDGGPTVITAPYLINELFELFKKDPKDYIKLSPLKIWYQFVFEDKTKFNYSGDENEMKRQVEKISKEDVEGYEKLVNFTKKIFDKGFTELADVPFDKPFVMMQQLPALLKLKSYKSVYSLVSSYIKNEIDESEKLRSEAKMLLDSAQKKLDTAQSVSNEILEQAKKDGDRLIIELNDKFHKSSEIKKNSAQTKIVQMKDAAIKEIKNTSVKIAVDSVKKIITTSVDKSKLDTLFQKNLDETKEELKKINS